MPESPVPSSPSSAKSPDYASLVRLLVEPLLESPGSLKINCEQANQSKRVWIRVAFEGAEQGRVFGRGGRNIQAIRRLLDVAAKEANQSVYLDIYGSQDRHRQDDRRDRGSDDKRRSRKPRSRNFSPPKPVGKSRS